MSADSDFDRVVAIGDLNGALAILRDILRGTGIIDRSDQWIAGRVHLIQVGDIFDRGGGACASIELLLQLKVQAEKHGGRVTMLLGNHEVMAALGDERWCTAEEFLWFATEEQRQAWPGQVEQARRQLESDFPPSAQSLLLELRLNHWKLHHAPGRDALRRELASNGSIGRVIRTLPVAAIAGDCVFCHAGIAPQWARLGIEGLNQAAQQAWHSAQDPNGIFHASSGPLWNRQLVLDSHTRRQQQLSRSLELLGVQRMVVGHTPTGNIPGCRSGSIAQRHGGKLICIDVGMGGSQSGVALILEDGAGYEWSPVQTRVLWHADPVSRHRQDYPGTR
ncbi:MAG: metallophosphoesterase [Proteobacteria bacterium]|nr:metallophosphoesterase [Pseudomonadota bacterium]